MSFLSLSVCLFWVRPHSVTHCVLWPSSYFSLNVPQCLLPLQHLTFLKNSSISLLWSATCRIVSCSFPRHTCTHAQASGVNESHVRSLLRLPPLLCYSLSLSLAAVTHSHMEGIIVMTHSLTPVPGSSTERQNTVCSRCLCMCVWVGVCLRTNHKGKYETAFNLSPCAFVWEGVLFSTNLGVFTCCISCVCLVVCECGLKAQFYNGSCIILLPCICFLYMGDSNF